MPRAARCRSVWSRTQPSVRRWEQPANRSDRRHIIGFDQVPRSASYRRRNDPVYCRLDQLHQFAIHELVVIRDVQYMHRLEFRFAGKVVPDSLSVFGFHHQNRIRPNDVARPNHSHCRPLGTPRANRDAIVASVDCFGRWASLLVLAANEQDAGASRHHSAQFSTNDSWFSFSGAFKLARSLSACRNRVSTERTLPRSTCPCRRSQQQIVVPVRPMPPKQCA